MKSFEDVPPDEDEQFARELKEPRIIRAEMIYERRREAYSALKRAIRMAPLPRKVKSGAGK